LDKLIERASDDATSSRPSQSRPAARRDDSDEIERSYSMKSPKKKKMSSLLGDIFEF
jgi:Zn-finger nucleic acid-binding protein